MTTRVLRNFNDCIQSQWAEQWGRWVLTWVSTDNFLKNKNSLKGQVPYMFALYKGTGIKGSDLSQVYILISIFIFSVCVYECAGLHTLWRLRTTLRSHFPPDALWDPATKLRLTGLCAGTGTQASHLASPQAEFFSQDLIVFTCFQIMSNVAVYSLPRPFWSRMWLLKKRDY